ncbi:hypothetical protein B484DRAFT_416004 [Ochromonadaceae sp. CCMP2298]|nr:hypothetical protein B484DRAFT_416004 [Ochromonadaceae sp. CCMP2298]
MAATRNLLVLRERREQRATPLMVCALYIMSGQSSVDAECCLDVCDTDHKPEQTDEFAMKVARECARQDAPNGTNFDQGPQDARSDQQRYTDLLQRTGIASVPFLLRAAAPLLAALPLNARPARADVAPFPRRGFQTKSGLKYFDITESTHGPTPRYGELVSFFYTCYYRPSSEAPLETVDGTPKDAPFLQKHGNGRLIRGIEESLHTMHVGSKRRIVVPQPLGFASFGLGPLPVDPFRRRRLGDLIGVICRQ